MQIDGVIQHGHPGVLSQLTNGYNTRIAVDSPIALEIMANLTGDEISVDVTVTTAGEAVSGNHKLRIALINMDLMDFYPAPNGQDDFHYDCLNMTPDAVGIDCAVAANSSQTFSATLDWPVTIYGQEMELDNVKVIAFVQDESDKEVLNVDWVYPGESNVGLSYGDNASLITAGLEVQYDMTISNLLRLDDNFNVAVETNLPEGWSFQYTTPSGIETGNSVISLIGDASYESDVTITTNEAMGVDGTVTFSITSDSFPEAAKSVSFYVNAAGDVMIVNETLVPANMAYYTDAMAELTAFDGLTSSVWNNAIYALDEAELMSANPEIIIWAGGADGEMNAQCIAAMVEYLDDGGNLWLNGNMIADNLSGTDLIMRLGATGQGHFEEGNHIIGYTDEVFFGTVDADLFGGDGADNNGSPAVFGLFGGSECLKLSRINRTGIYRQNNDYNSVLFGFPFEAIATAEARTLVMSGVAAVFGMTESGAPDNPGVSDLPTEFALQQNYPNPFNPSTTISFSVPMTSSVTLQVYNVEGREVMRLAEGEYQAGNHSVTFDASDMASGVYIYRMTSVGEVSFNASRKMLLIK